MHAVQENLTGSYSSSLQTRETAPALERKRTIHATCQKVLDKCLEHSPEACLDVQDFSPTFNPFSVLAQLEDSPTNSNYACDSITPSKKRTRRRGRGEKYARINGYEWKRQKEQRKVISGASCKKTKQLLKNESIQDQNHASHNVDIEDKVASSVLYRDINDLRTPHFRLDELSMLNTISSSAHGTQATMPFMTSSPAVLGVEGSLSRIGVSLGTRQVAPAPSLANTQPSISLYPSDTFALSGTVMSLSSKPTEMSPSTILPIGDSSFVLSPMKTAQVSSSSIFPLPKTASQMHLCRSYQEHIISPEKETPISMIVTTFAPSQPLSTPKACQISSEKPPTQDPVLAHPKDLLETPSFPTRLVKRNTAVEFSDSASKQELAAFLDSGHGSPCWCSRHSTPNDLSYSPINNKGQSVPLPSRLVSKTLQSEDMSSRMSAKIFDGGVDNDTDACISLASSSILSSPFEDLHDFLQAFKSDDEEDGEDWTIVSLESKCNTPRTQALHGIDEDDEDGMLSLSAFLPAPTLDSVRDSSKSVIEANPQTSSPASFSLSLESSLANPVTCSEMNKKGKSHTKTKGLFHFVSTSEKDWPTLEEAAKIK